MNSKLPLLILASAAGLCAQFGPPGPPPPAPGKAGAPVDLTGYWVAYVTEDWRWRMVTPLKGDAASIPTNPEGRKVIDAWDPAKDEAAGLQCKAYGAPAIMRVPGRLHITWQDDKTLKIETDAGQQTRLLHFSGEAPRGAAPSWQGYSAAKWEGPAPTSNPPVSFGLGLSQRLGSRSRSLEVTTTQLRAGYLRKNGVPYSDKTVLKEYFDAFSEPNADTWLMVMTVVDDPTYLAVPFVTTSHFKKIADATGWDPEPCTAR
ncbi:MAG TPA: hypothetical protein VK686_11315 [Bryobacteraceae bacterium]|nr:hypothetical protein [Bryobacteraceae bacterium]